MSRPLRITYDGAWYHVMNRGLARNLIFFNNEHREIFIQLLAEINKRYQIEIHAYCLMNNHYHLLIRTPLGNISRAMRHLDGVFTQRVNNLVKRDGPLFRGRYKAILVQADEYLLRLSRYIHLNPVKAKLVTASEQFNWSSYRAYLFGDEPCWLYTTEVLNHFDSNFKRCEYRNFVEEGIDKELNDFYKKTKSFPILGTKIFSKSIKENHLKEQHKTHEIPEHKLLNAVRYNNIEVIMKTVAAFYNTGTQDLKLVKKKNGNFPRAVGIYLSRTIGQNTFPEIAKAFTNTSASGASLTCYRMERMLATNKKMNDDIEELKNVLIRIKSIVGT